MVLPIIMLFMDNIGIAQMPPTGKYNTTNYLKDRKAIELLKTLPDSLQHLDDDYLAIGPEGEISYGFEQWKKVAR